MLRIWENKYFGPKWIVADFAIVFVAFGLPAAIAESHVSKKAETVIAAPVKHLNVHESTVSKTEGI